MSFLRVLENDFSICTSFGDIISKQVWETRPIMKDLYDSENVLITFSSVQEMCQREMGSLGTCRGREEEGGEEGDGDWQIKWDKEQKRNARQSDKRKSKVLRDKRIQCRGDILLDIFKNNTWKVIDFFLVIEQIRETLIRAAAILRM